MTPVDITIRKRQYRSTLGLGLDGNTEPTLMLTLNESLLGAVMTYAIANSSDVLVVIDASATLDKVIIAIEGVSAA